jgi:hypothetical protein
VQEKVRTEALPAGAGQPGLKSRGISMLEQSGECCVVERKRYIFEA